MYEYADAPLTPKVAAHLIQELAGGGVHTRARLVELVAHVHTERGGAPTNAASPTNVVKKALHMLSDAGIAQNPNLGYWRILNTTDNPAPASTPEPDPVVETPAETAPAPTEAVYLYYLPAYRDRAETEGKPVWECKIGRSTRDPLERVLTQASTALPERPVVALLCNTPDSRALEHTIHGVLSLRGRTLDNTPGVEWFLTSPDEVADIIAWVDPDLGASCEVQLAGIAADA